MQSARRRVFTRSVLATGSMLGVATGVWAQEPAGTAAAAVSTAVPVQSQAAAADDETTAEHEVSQVRIVRLSQVRGIVQMDRNTGRGYEAAFANIPVVAGARLRTGEGVAEVEFEDNSSLRLAPNSEVRFGQLGRLAAGTTATTVDVSKGLVYVALEKTKGNEFTLVDGAARMALAPGAHLRFAADQPQAELAVFDGSAQLLLGSSVTSLSKKQTVMVSPASQTVSAVSKGTEEGDWDGWDKQGVDYHKQKANVANVGGFGLYGTNDLNYYGSFSDLPGCGSVWRPYFASAAWDPFANGVWAYYPSAGYSWVSPYPWGWLPYHSGSWTNCGNAGWGWRPGGGWYGVQNRQAMRLANHTLPHPVPPMPGRNATTLVPVNMHLLHASGLNEEAGFTFRRDSAGYGVPRAAFGNLHGFAQHVDRAGSVTRQLPDGMVSLSAGHTNRNEVEAGMQRAGRLPGGGSPNLGGNAMRQGGAPGATSMHVNSGAFRGGNAGANAPGGMRSGGNSGAGMSAPRSGGSMSMPSGGGMRGGSMSMPAPSGHR